ncbi:MAG: zinc ABC transporter substrate-binding protein [Rhodospirillaceae bacterium]|jgi:zinc transport system substrate-binding protein
MRHRCLRIKAGTFALLSAATGLFAVGLLSPFNVHAQSKTPSVVASIKPIHSLVSNVMSGIGKPGIIIAGGASPHTFSMRPSKAKLLSKADIVFWVGDEMETFLIKPLNTLNKKAAIVPLSKAPGVRLLKARLGGMWEEHLHEEGRHDSHGHDSHGHGGHVHDHDKNDQKNSHDKHKGEDSHGEFNMHVWLGRANAIAMVRTVVKTLSKKDKTNASRYKKNGERTIERINKAYSSINQDLAPVKKVPFLVFHDAYPYFEKDTGLTAVGSISTQTARKPGAKRLYEIRRKIVSLGVKCIFAEPQFEPKLIKAITEGTNAKTGILDPLGAALKTGPEAYFQLIENLSKNLKTCLSQTS